ncbi:MAG TPA: YceI family protein [Saprospiraceae bacterium]|nr:YceI family protein [Saprospiraceae bacterium]
MKHLLFSGCLFLGIALLSCKPATKADNVVNEITASDNKNEPPGQYQYQVIPNLSTVKWMGSKPTGTHNGTVPVADGGMNVDGGNITSGKVDLDMTQLVVLDPPGDMGKSLEEHLKGTAPGKEEDFFNVGKYSTATFEITSSSKIENDPESTHTINGNLTIKDITKPVSFKAKVEMIDNGLVVSAAPFNIDRTQFDIRFKSRKFFDNLKDDYVNDEFQIGFYLVAHKKG